MIAITICTKDRPMELGLLLQSLRTQDFQDFDVFILDDMGGTNLMSYHFLSSLITRMKQEHNVFIYKSEYHYGVSKARQEILDKAFDNFKYYDYFLRVDDDVILEPDYISRLLKVIDEGYDIASGVTPPFAPLIKRNPDFVDIANKVILQDGKFIFDGDDCGMQYTESKIVPAHHFRSSALIKREVHEKVKYYPTKLTKHGFREETIFSFKAQLEGFKIGVDLGAVAWHLNTPSGGERFPDAQNLAKFNLLVLDEFVLKNKELNKLFPYEDIGLKLKKENNMRR